MNDEDELEGLCHSCEEPPGDGIHCPNCGTLLCRKCYSESSGAQGCNKRQTKLTERLGAMAGIVREPIFTDDQVKSANEYQQKGYFHPFTCGNHCGAVLVLTPDGWICPTEGCGYTQDWAHRFMLDWSWKEHQAPFHTESTEE